MSYVEFPADPIVDVHWHKKKNGNGDPLDDPWPCGAFKHGYGLYDDATGTYSFFPQPGNSIFILTRFNIYGIGYDILTAHEPFQPYSYWWSTADYLGSVIDSRDVPFVWFRPGSWTVTVDVSTVEERFNRKWQDLGVGGGTVNSVSIQEFRNLNIQALQPLGTPALIPDREVQSSTIDIVAQADDEIYPPGFRVRYKATVGGGAERVYDETYPPSTIQAHCKHETTGDYPPRPPNLEAVLYDYPAPGRNDWPLRPPPPPPFV